MTRSSLHTELPPYTVTRKRIRTLRLTVKTPDGAVHARGYDGATDVVVAAAGPGALFAGFWPRP